VGGKHRNLPKDDAERMWIEIVDRIRRNHAVEHATIAGLLERGAATPLGGYAMPAGFLVYGGESGEVVQTVAAEALDRMKQGETDLAVSPHCGTNLVVGALLAGLLSGVVLRDRAKRFRRLPLAAAAIAGAVLAARPLGSFIQRHYTTLASVESMSVVGVKTIRLGPVTVHWVRTSETAAASS
jgi:hypothetical protein